MNNHFQVVCLLCLLNIPAFAADPPSIDKLVEQLGSRSFVERERATKALKDRGPEALPALRKALLSTDEEVRKRAEKLIPPLEIEEALLPKRITLKADKSTYTNVLAEISKQTGFKLSPGAIRSNNSHSIDWKDKPFWEAVEEIGQEPGSISTDYNTRERTLHLKAGNGKTPYLLVRGPFRLAATWFHEDRDVDLTSASDKDAPRNKGLTLSMSVHAEPRISIQKISPAKVLEAIDSEGNSLLEPMPPPPPKNEPKVLPGGRRPVAQPPAVPVTPPGYPSGRGTFRGESTYFSDIRLRRVSESAKTLKLVRGEVTVKSILIRKWVVVTDKLMQASGTSFKAGEDGLQITRVSQQGGGYIEIEIAAPRYEEGSTWQWGERFKVEDDAGNRFQSAGDGSRFDGRGHWISMYFSPPFNKKGVGAASKLIFEEWIIHEHTIPFEFKNVPMP